MGRSGTTGGYGYIPGRQDESEASSLRLFNVPCEDHCGDFYFLENLPGNENIDNTIYTTASDNPGGMAVLGIWFEELDCEAMSGID